MDSAKNAVSSFLGRGGTQQTDVDERVNAPVTSETVKPHRHEETTEAVDREIHQDHYHTTVQPVAARETLPEQHVHNLAPQIEKTIEHGSREQDKARIESELGQFRNTSTTAPITQTTGAAPSVTGEHVHHHVHEVVQPIIHKETIQPEVVHTTVPIHEKHIAPSEHHGLSTLPVRTLDDFKRTGASLTGGTHSREEYEGHPRTYDPSMQVEREPVDVDPRAHEGMHDPEKTGHFGHSDHHHGTGLGAGVGGTGTAAALAGAGSHYGGHGTTTSTGTGVGGPDSTHSTGLVGSGTGSSSLPGNRHGLQDESYTGGHNTSSAMGSGVAGVAAGDVSRDLGRDHTRAHEVSDLNPRDTTSTFGDSGTSTVGTALGGRSDGNTSAGAARAVAGDNHGHTTHSHHESPAENIGSKLGSTHEGREREPTNLTGGEAEPRQKDIANDDSVQHASKIGEDPSLTKDRGGNTGKLTGTGIDGSHSAVFGLTPDGHRHNDTKHGMDESALSNEDNKEDKRDRERAAGTGGDTSSRAPESGKVAEQLNDPRVAEKGHGGDAVSQGGDNNKPGAGVPSVST